MDLVRTGLQAAAAYETGGASLGLGSGLDSALGGGSPSLASSARGGNVSVGGLTEGAEWNPNVMGGFGAFAPSDSTVQIMWLAVAAALVAVLVWKKKS